MEPRIPPLTPFTTPEHSEISGILAAVDCGLVIHGPKAEIVACNQRALTLLGLTRDQLLGRTSFDPDWLVVGEDGHRFNATEHPAVRTLQTGEPTHGVVMGVRRGDRQTTVWLLVTANPLKDEHHQVKHVVVTFADISDRIAAETATRDEQRLFRELMETVPAGICLTDRTGKILYVNQGVEGILARPASQLLGQAFSDPRWAIPDGEEPGRESRPLPLLAALGCRANFSNLRQTFRTPEGQLRVVTINCAPLLDAHGEPERTVLALRDITQLEAHERALRASEARLSLTLQAADCGMLEWRAADPERLEVDTGWLTRHGFSPDHLPTTLGAWEGLIDPAAREDLRQTILAPSAGASIHWEGNIRANRPLRVRISGRCMETTHLGEPARILAIVHDITERHQREARERELDRKLARIARFHSVATLAGGLAHDFNNLLANISAGTAAVLDELGPGHPTRPALDLAIESTDAASALVRQLLAISGEGPSQVHPLDLNALIQHTIAELRPSLGESLTVELDLSPNLPAVEADRGQIQQLLENLLRNAIEAQPGQAPQVHVSTCERNFEANDVCIGPNHPSEGPYVCIELTDPGVGIAPEEVERIFEPFISSHPGRRGLGLAAVIGILRVNRGFIQLEHPPGGGSRFRVSLPALPGSHIPAAPQIPHILVVEDDPLLRRVTTRLLKRGGYRVTEAQDGRAAILLVENNPGDFQAVISDFRMPEMNGDELIRRLRLVEPSLPVLLMSGYVTPEHLRRMVGIADTPFLQKPFTVGELIATIGGVLGPPPKLGE